MLKWNFSIRFSLSKRKIGYLAPLPLIFPSLSLFYPGIDSPNPVTEVKLVLCYCKYNFLHFISNTK